MTQILNKKPHFKNSRTLTAVITIIYAAMFSAYCEALDEFTENSANVAVAVESAYNQLQDLGCDVNATAATETCNGNVFTVFRITRTLVQTANDLNFEDNANEPTRFSLGVDTIGYEEVLRWNGSEEFSSHESMSSKFSNNQLASVSSRITALRAGSIGFNVKPINNPNYLANDSHGSSTSHATSNYGTGLNAGDSAVWSKLGGFLNGSYTYGNLGATANEDAFDFDGAEINAGLDYRINNQWVIGGILGYVTQRVDFDSSLSTTDGSVDMDGLSLTPFVLYQADKWYATASLNYLDNNFTSRRAITYASLNVNISNTDTETVSKNSANAFTFNTAGGYSFQLSDRLTLEPSISLNYQKLTIDEFEEDDINDDGYNLRVLEQKIRSFETIAAIKLQYVTSNKFGVFTPFIDIKSFTQHHTDKRYIKSIYAGIADIASSDAYFVLATNPLDTDYKSIGVGVASVLRGARQSSFDSVAAGGIQAFVSLRMLMDLGEFEQQTITAGVRYEF